MNSDYGGLSPEERRRRTAVEIARRKVMASFGDSARVVMPKDASGVVGTSMGTSTQVNNVAVRPLQTQEQPSSYKQAPVQPRPVVDDFKKYHSAWQGYYQKYYSEYYAKAAKQFIETEKLKQERSQADEKREVHSDNGNVVLPVDTSLRARIRRLADEESQHKQKLRKWMPLVAGLTVAALILFLQYNRLIFAPIMAYVSPGNASETTITEVDPTVAVAVKAEPTLLIPKLNIDVPIHLGISNDTATVNAAMNNGVAQFAIPGASALPGQVGNLVISGHSAGDIYSNNQYKFIFSGLERLVEGDLIYIDYEGVRYTYKMVKKDTVEPTNVQALVYTGDKPILTLVTCWPLGTSRYRLLVTAEQINPNPDGAEQSTEKPVANTEEVMMPENEPTFFEGIWNWLTGN